MGHRLEENCSEDDGRNAPAFPAELGLDPMERIAEDLGAEQSFQPQLVNRVRNPTETPISNIHSSSMSFLRIQDRSCSSISKGLTGLSFLQTHHDEHSSRSVSGTSEQCSLYMEAATDSIRTRSISNWRRTCRKVVSSKYFDMFIVGVILANSLQIGVEQALRLEGQKSLFLTITEHVFLLIYIFELVMRIGGRGMRAFSDYWVVFDFILVVTGIVTIWILPHVLCEVCIGNWANVMIMRAARLLRLTKTMHLLVRFPLLWMMIRGLVSSSGTMFYTLVTLVCVLYALGLVGVELITNNSRARGPDADPEFVAMVDEYFSNLGTTMLTLLQFVTMDSLSSIYTPLIRKDWSLVFYFLATILTISIVLANLITAVVVNRALEQAEEDREARKVQEMQRKKRILKDMRGVFCRLDADGSGQITWDELISGAEEDIADLKSVLTLDNTLHIFKMLDVDNTGSITLDEFFSGITGAVISGRNIEFKRLEKHLQAMKKKLDHFCQTAMNKHPHETPQQEVDPKWMRDLVDRVQSRVAKLLADELQGLRLELNELMGRPVLKSSCYTASEVKVPDLREFPPAAAPAGAASHAGPAPRPASAKPRLSRALVPPPLVLPAAQEAAVQAGRRRAMSLDCGLFPQACHTSTSESPAAAAHMSSWRASWSHGEQVCYRV